MARTIGYIINSDQVKERDGLYADNVLNAIEWKIHYFSYILLRKCDEYYQSPRFTLLQSQWYLQICLSSESEKDDKQWFGLYLCRAGDRYDGSTKNIVFTFGIRENGAVFRSIRRGKKVFHENGNRAGVQKFLRRFARKNSSGRRDAFNCTADNCLTIFCAMNEYPPTTISEDEGGSIGVDDENSFSEDEESDSLQELLKYDQGKVVFCEDMKRLFHSEQLCDVKILVNGEEIRAHKAILAARSPVFSAMFEHEMKEKKSDFVEISDSTLDAFKEFLRYLYTGNLLEISTTHVCEVYVLADKYIVKQLTRECIYILEENVSADNFCDFISLAIKYKESELLGTMTEYFVEHATSILQTVQWEYFTAENPAMANELFTKSLSLK